MGDRIPPLDHNLICSFILRACHHALHPDNIFIQLRALSFLLTSATNLEFSNETLKLREGNEALVVV